MQHTARANRAAGFTFTELIVTLLVIAVVAALALPKVGEAPLLVSVQADQLADDIRYVQALSMMQGQRYRINFTTTGYTFTFADAGGTPVQHPVTGSTAQISLNSGVTIGLPPTGLPNNLVAFDGRGIPYTDGLATTALGVTAVITLTGGASVKVVQITQETGRVQ